MENRSTSSQPFLEDCSHPSTNEAGSYLTSKSDELSPPQAGVFKGALSAREGGLQDLL